MFPWCCNIWGGMVVMVDGFIQTGSGLDLVVLPFKLATLGPHIAIPSLIDSRVMGELSSDPLSIIRSTALVVRPAVF